MASSEEQHQQQNDLSSSSSSSSPPSLNSPTTSPSALHIPSPPLRSTSDMTSTTSSSMSASSTPLGSLNAARGKPPSQPIAARGGGQINPDIMAKMKAFSLGRQNAPPPQLNRGQSGQTAPIVQSPGPAVPGFPSNLRIPTGLNRPSPQFSNSSPIIPGSTVPGRGMSLAEKRGMKMPGGLPGAAPGAATPTTPAGKQKPKMRLSDIGGGPPTSGQQNGDLPTQEPRREQSAMEKYADIIDTKTGTLKFKGKAVIHGQGIEFESGRSFSISLDEVDTLDELGSGNYGTVFKVRHSRPRFRLAGQGLAGNKARGMQVDEQSPDSSRRQSETTPTSATTRAGTSGIVMAMKEMRLELDDAKFQTIIMELDVLHRCVSPYIVDFYGAFFQEGSVYICMEFMDGGSVDKLYGDGVPENVLRKITLSTTLGLKSLKEEHNIIHRDVKPTNILVNTRGEIKICDFGVSGNLVSSIAKTNIGCQSYMAPERISSGGMASSGAGPGAGTYSVQSDIWSLGLSIIECALGTYPYPPETYDNIFSQLSAIVDGDPPDLPADKFSDAAHNFVAGCLNKIPKLRPTYPMLLQHAWLAPLVKPQTIMEEDEELAEAAVNGDIPPANTNQAEGFVDKEVGEWVIDALDRRKRGVMGSKAKPALHAAPLDAMGSGTAAAAQ